MARVYSIKLDNGKIVEYPAVTSILSVIAKPGLYAWYAKMGLEAEKVKQKAADLGSRVHHIIQSILRNNPIFYLDDDPKVVQAVNAFLKWRKEIELNPLMLEHTVHSVKHAYAGTLDCLGMSKDGLAIFDWKTSNGIWPEYQLQLEAYRVAKEEMAGSVIPSMYVVRFGKVDGAFEAVEYKPSKDHFEAFLAAKKLYEVLNFGKHRDN